MLIARPFEVTLGTSGGKEEALTTNVGLGCVAVSLHVRSSLQGKRQVRRATL